MKLKNISKKVIHIGTTVLMPDNELPVTAKVAGLPSIKALAKAGCLVIDDSEEKLAAAKKEAALNAKKAAEAEAAKKAKEEAEKKAAAEAEAAKKAAAEQK